MTKHIKIINIEITLKNYVMKGENHMKRNGLVHHMIDYIKDILSQFNLGKQRETEIFMSSNDFQR